MGRQSFHLAQLRPGLRPFRLHWFPRLRSTNDHATALRKCGQLFAPAIVLTGCQTAGRGRAGNTWWSGPGCLTVTFAMPIEEHLSPHQLPLVAGLAARNAAAQITGDDSIALKWPNDVVYRGRKLAGLLCQRVHRVDLIGLGMNINLPPFPARRAPSSATDESPAACPPALRRRITALNEIAGRPFDPTDCLIRIAREMYRMLSRRNERPFPALLQEYDLHHALVGVRVSATTTPGRPPIQGTCQGLDSLGRLVLRQGSITHRIVAGHIEPI